MKSLFDLSIYCFALLAVAGCKDAGVSPAGDAWIQGQVYSIATPGPTPINWTPPPLESVSTIVVLDDSRKVVKEFRTDAKGKFQTSLPPGTYYLRVKESLLPAETGPYRVRPGERITVVAHFDNGMR
jgi:hypothetical protein